MNIFPHMKKPKLLYRNGHVQDGLQIGPGFLEDNLHMQQQI